MHLSDLNAFGTGWVVCSLGSWRLAVVLCASGVMGALWEGGFSPPARVQYGVC